MSVTTEGGRARRQASPQPKSALNARGLKTRRRLKEAARYVLNKKGYRNIRVQDVTGRASVANGLFYHYFLDLREVVAELAGDLFDELRARTEALDESASDYAWLYRNHVNVVSLFAENPGILACLFGLAGDYDEYDAIWKRNAHDWNLTVAQFLMDRAGCDEARAERMAFVLGAVTEGIIYQSLIRRTEDLYQFGDRPEAIAEVIAVIWYRTIFLRDPDQRELRAAGASLCEPR